MNKTSNKILAAFLLLFILAGFVFVIFVKAKGTKEYQNKTEITISDELVEVKFSSNTTKEELEDLTKRLKEEKNIDLNYSETKFDKKGEVEVLKIQVDCNDGHKGGATVKSLELSMGNHGFFRRDYTDTTENAFSIGGTFTVKEID